MTLTQDNKPPVPALIMLAGGVAAALLVVLLLIIPAVNETDRLRRDIAVTQAEIEEKRLLDPVYAQMVALKKAQEELEVPPVSPLAAINGDISRITADLEQTARLSGMNLVSVSPRPASLEGGSVSLRVAVVVEGGFEAFREFLFALLEIPYLQALPNFQVREIIGSREFTLQLQVKLR